MARSKRKIGTLVEDIKGLLRGIREGKGLTIDNKDLAALGAMMAMKVENNLKGKTKKARPAKTLYMSEIGTACRRKLWYSVHEDTDGPFDKEPLDYSTVIKFIYGDILEELLLFLVEQSGHEVTDKQQLIEISLPRGWVLRGKLDAKIDGVIIDVKSASSYSFEKFKRGLSKKDDPFGYMKQLQSYNYGSDVTAGQPTGFLVINKETGAVALDAHEADFKEWSHDAATLIDSIELDKPPARHYASKTTDAGNEKLGTECSYCAYKFECWKDANAGQGPRIFLYANKPEFLVDIKTVPRVPEATRNGKKD